MENVLKSIKLKAILTDMTALATRGNRWRYLFPAMLLVALNAMSVYAVACPILCAAEQQPGRTDISQVREMSCFQEDCCKETSGPRGASGTPCSDSGHACVQYHGAFSFVIPAAAAVHCQAQPAFLSVARSVPANRLTPQTVIASASPPEFSAGRDVGQSNFLLRI